MRSPDLGWELSWASPLRYLGGSSDHVANPACHCSIVIAKLISFTLEGLAPHQPSLMNARVPWVFDVSIHDASVLHGYEWDGMNMSVAGNYVSMFVGDLHGSSGLIEQVAPDAYVGFDGVSGSSVEPSFSTVSMPFDGVIDYCKLPTGSPLPTSSGTYSCLPAQPSATVQCTSTQHMFVLSRR